MVAAVTAYNIDENLMKCYEVGMVEVMGKPVVQRDIFTFLANYYPGYSKLKVA